MAPARRKKSTTRGSKGTRSRPPVPEENGKVVEAEIDPGAITYTLEFNGFQLGFLRLLLTSATVRPAVLKKLNGECQEKVEALIGPMPDN